ncbi:MAG: hypothetical protein IIT39_01305 [Clostridia bacterium]|nr:hypothetical protein [Clostridia bacterium]
MNNIYFNIDVFKRKVYFFSVSSPPKRELIHTYTFDDMMYMADNYSTGDYQKKLQGLYDLMMKQIDDKEDEQVQSLTRQLDNEFKENIFASVCLSILYSTYQNQKDTLNHLGVINSFIDSVSQKITLQVKGKIESKFSEITNSMNNFIDCVNNDFQHTPERIFQSDGKYILEFNKRDGNMLYSVNEFVEPLIHIFLTNLYIGNLKVFTCKHCGKKYFDNTDKGCCPKEICQKAEEKENNKIFREKRKANPYKNLLDNFGLYIRQQKHKLTQKNLSADVIAQFDDEKNFCYNKVKMEISIYQNSGKPIDDELKNYIEEQKNYMKNLYDNLSNVNIQ